MMSLWSFAHQLLPLLRREPAIWQRFCLSGGGTGGHVYPALAVAEVLFDNRGRADQEQGVSGVSTIDQPSLAKELVYIGSIGGMEQRIVAQESRLPYHALPTAALRGRSPLVLLRNIATLMAGTLAALRLLQDLQPVAILGTGGYVCVPLFLAARLRNIPTIIYLPDVVPGLAVRFLSRIATCVACSVADSRDHLGARFALQHGNPHEQTTQPAQAREKSSTSKHFPRLVVTGYPVRQELFVQERAVCCQVFGLREDMPVLVVYGGSRGARSINRAMQALLPTLLSFTQVIHICGREGDEGWLRETVEGLDARLQARYRLYPYLGTQAVRSAEQEVSVTDEEEGSAQPTMVRALGAADLAVCRSGASVLGELPALGLPAILVPYPYVHQDENADYLVRNGAAIKIADSEMMGTQQSPLQSPLFLQIRRLLTTDRQVRISMATQSRLLARPDAAQCLAKTLYSLAARRGCV